MTEKQKAKETEGDQLIQMFAENSARAEKQLKAPITVILGNPPYSVGQRSVNDNNQNTEYKYLDMMIAQTYAMKSTATTTRASYDTYIKAFCWATDRLGDNGIIGFVTNGAFLDNSAMDGFRECLIEDFNHIYVFNLRGNQRTSGELSRKEGGKIFGSGSRTPVTITILIKRKGVKKDGFVRYHDIGDYLSRDQKLAIISEFGDVSAIKWSFITPNENNDWINQRNQSYINFFALGDKKKIEKETIFSDNYALGLETSRDPWMYSFSEEQVIYNSNRMIDFYNLERERCQSEFFQQITDGTVETTKKVKETFITNIMSTDATKISWTTSLIPKLVNNTAIEHSDRVEVAMRRPFCKKHLAYNVPLIHRPSCWANIFPTQDIKNLIICISGVGGKKRFFCTCNRLHTR